MEETPSKRVADYLSGHDEIDMEIIHMGGPKCPPPYAIVYQSGGDREIAQVSVMCFDEDPQKATDAAKRIWKVMRYANIGGSVPSLVSWTETYVVLSDFDDRAAIELRYNLPVYQER